MDQIFDATADIGIEPSPDFTKRVMVHLRQNIKIEHESSSWLSRFRHFSEWGLSHWLASAALASVATGVPYYLKSSQPGAEPKEKIVSGSGIIPSSQIQYQVGQIVKHMIPYEDRFESAHIQVTLSDGLSPHVTSGSVAGQKFDLYLENVKPDDLRVSGIPIIFEVKASGNQLLSFVVLSKEGHEIHRGEVAIEAVSAEERLPEVHQGENHP